MITSPQEYIDSIEGAGKGWLLEFYAFMREKYSDIQPVMFRQRPMYKIGKSYVMFTAAKEHFSVHTMNFELVEEYRAKIPGSGKAKGCLNIKYNNIAAKPLLQELCDKVTQRNRLPGAPAPGGAPEMSYEEHLQRTFTASKAKWRPLYDALLGMAKGSLPGFIEYFPAVGILWKHSSTFAVIKCKKDALQVEFYADKLCEDRRPVKYLQSSANRVLHTVELTDGEELDLLMLWIRESYLLTVKK